MRPNFFPFICCLTLLVTLTCRTSAQWPPDPSQNLAVCDTTGEQALPKIASTSDGGCYISWFDARSGNYHVYMQRLDPQGVKQWSSAGLLISNNPQNSSLVDYDLAADATSGAVVAFTDVRDGDLKVYAYRIGSQGEFLWGNNGVALSSTSDFQANPRIATTTDSAYVIVWILASTPGKIAMQRLSANGQKLWGSTPILIEGAPGESLSRPFVVASDSGSVIVVWTAATGSFPALNTRLRAQKFSSAGTSVWGSAPVAIQDAGTIPFYADPAVASDGNNGVVVAWYDDRNLDNLYSSFVQRVSANGTVLFPANGSEVSTTSGFHHLSPSVAHLSSTDETFVFWAEKNSLQSQAGVYGQKFSSNGSRLWANAGKTFTPLGPASLFGPYVVTTDSATIVFFLEGNPSGLDDSLVAFKSNPDGNMVWAGSFVTLSRATHEKLHSVFTLSADGVAKAAWEDRRNDGGIYAQNINPDGSLGSLPVSVGEQHELPSSIMLMQNYPNPFNPSTKIGFRIKGTGYVTLKVFDALGREVATLVNEKKEPGTYTVDFDGSGLAGGVYFYRLSSDNVVLTKKLILIK